MKENSLALRILQPEETSSNISSRKVFYSHLQQAVGAARRDNKPLALLMMDLDRFKEVNHTLGHRMGDLLLEQVGPRIQRALERADVLVRLGGDEFAVLLRGAASASQATGVAREIIKSLEQPFVLEGLKVDIQASIGIALFPDHGSTADALMQRADIAMYAAKANKAGYSVYASEQEQSNPQRLALMGELRQGIVHDQLFLVYQPKVDLQTGRVEGVEALVRWKHPRLGVIPPDQFIPVAEQTGLIMPLTLWVLNDALRQWHKWREAGLELNVAANLSMLNLHSRALPHQIEGLLKACNVPSGFLGLEITESSIMEDPTRAMEILKQMSDMGLQFAIDDFGTGYSSLAYLKKLPVDELKIDKSFVMNMASEEDDTVIVRSTIDLGHNLGLKVVAEGVENQETIEKLTLLGCDIAQGYHLSRPLPAAELTRWLTELAKGPPKKE